MEQDYILVASADDEAAVELPLEEDGTVLLSTVEAQFPGATGIKFINPKTGSPRGIRLTSDRLHPPDASGWGDRTYFCVFSKVQDNKRKVESDDGPASKVLKGGVKCTDIMVRGLSFDTTEDSLKQFCEENFGELAMVQVKKNSSGQSRGFGFVKFVNYADQRKALKVEKVQIDGRTCKISLSPSALDTPSKVFIGNLSADITIKDLKEYFIEMGDITDAFIPKPFRGFGFVTFLDPEVAKAACFETHDIKGVKVTVQPPTPIRGRSGGDRNGRDRDDNPRRNDNRGGRYGGRNDRSFDQGGRGRDGGGYNDHDRDFGGLSPSRLISVIKDAVLGDVLGSRGNNYRNNRDDGPYDNGNNRSDSRNSWSNYDRYN